MDNRLNVFLIPQRKTQDHRSFQRGKKFLKDGRGFFVAENIELLRTNFRSLKHGTFKRQFQITKFFKKNFSMFRIY